MTGFDVACGCGALALLILLVSEWRQLHLGVVIFKTIASTCFLWAGIEAGALQTALGLAIFLGLVLSWFGDVFLIARRSPRLLKLGIASFLLGHIAFTMAFLLGGISLTTSALTVPMVLFIASRIHRWLSPHVAADMRRSVVAYICVISTMVVVAAGTLTAGQPWTRLGGAIAFFTSDIAVARQRFVQPSMTNRLWGLPLYYLAQFTLAGSLLMP